MNDSGEKLIRMATQIIRNLPPTEARADQVADHIRRFWTPRMRQDLHAAAAGQDIDPILEAALTKL